MHVKQTCCLKMKNIRICRQNSQQSSQMFINDQRNYLYDLFKINYFLKNLSHIHFTEWNVRIKKRTRLNIDALIVIALIFSTSSNCLFHNMIDLMFWKFLTNSFRERNSFRRISHLFRYFNDHFLNVVQQNI